VTLLMLGISYAHARTSVHTIEGGMYWTHMNERTPHGSPHVCVRLSVWVGMVCACLLENLLEKREE